MLYEDKFGVMWHPEDVEQLSEKEYEELGLRESEERGDFFD